MMLFLAHMTPPLIPTYWIVFAVGLALGAILGYRMGLGTRMGLGYRKSLEKMSPSKMDPSSES